MFAEPVWGFMVKAQYWLWLLAGSLYVLITACGPGPDTGTDVQDQADGQDHSSRQVLSNMQSLVVSVVPPMEWSSFPSYWFASTQIKILNRHSEAVSTHVWCGSNKKFDAWSVIPPYSYMHYSWNCGTSTIYVYNGAPFGSGLDIEVQTY